MQAELISPFSALGDRLRVREQPDVLSQVLSHPQGEITLSRVNTLDTNVITMLSKAPTLDNTCSPAHHPWITLSRPRDEITREITPRGAHSLQKLLETTKTVRTMKIVSLGQPMLCLLIRSETLNYMSKAASISAILASLAVNVGS